MKAKSRARRPWTKADLVEFRKLARQGLSGSKIARRLKRTVGATYQKATSTGIRFTSKRRAKNRKKAA